MPANPMIDEIDAAGIGKKVGVAAAKGAGKAGVVAGKGAGKAGVALGNASVKAATEGKAVYKKRQDDKKKVRVCRPTGRAVVTVSCARRLIASHCGSRLCCAQTQITNPMFNNELSIADSSDEEEDNYEDATTVLSSEKPLQVRCSHAYGGAVTSEMLRSGCLFCRESSSSTSSATCVPRSRRVTLTVLVAWI